MSAMPYPPRHYFPHLEFHHHPDGMLADRYNRMAGAMLVILAACRIPSLRTLIAPEVLAAGDHLKQLLEGWQGIAGDPASPSVHQSVRIIGEADRFIQQVYGTGTGNGMGTC